MREGRGAQRPAMATNPRNTPGHLRSAPGDRSPAPRRRPVPARPGSEDGAPPASDTPKSSEVAPERPVAHMLRRMLASRAGLRQAIMLAEITGSPLGLRPWRN